LDIPWAGGTLVESISGEMPYISFGAGTCELSDTSGLELESLEGIEPSVIPDEATAGKIIRYGQEEWQ